MWERAVKWPFKRKTRVPDPGVSQQGSFMQEHGVLQCKCGEQIPMVLACHLPSVPVGTFAEFKSPLIKFENIPCPACGRAHSATMHPSQFR